VAGLAWNYAFPINKSLWTSSYVLYTSGLALNGLALCYWLVDVKGYRGWTKPFLAFGVNAITAFFLAGLLPRILNMIRVTGADGKETGLQGYLYQTLYTPLLSPTTLPWPGPSPTCCSSWPWSGGCTAATSSSKCNHPSIIPTLKLSNFLTL
jgi:predicted acyltransferase